MNKFNKVVLCAVIIFGFLGGFSQACTVDTDPCLSKSHYALPSQPGRCPTCPGGIGCDMYLINNGWYRSEYNIITEPTEAFRCGTLYPIWMNGTFPSEADDIVDRLACVRTWDDLCRETYRLMVKNCGIFSVYCLRDTPSSCPQRFCFDGPNVTTTTARHSTTTPVPATTDLRPIGPVSQVDDKECTSVVLAVVITGLAFCIVFLVALTAVVVIMKRKKTTHPEPSTTQEICNNRYVTPCHKEKSVLSNGKLYMDWNANEGQKIKY